MRLYEVVYILDPALDEGAVTAKLETFHALATSKGGEVTAVDHWGTRQLAYPIKRSKTGYYVIAQFTAEAEALPEFERILEAPVLLMGFGLPGENAHAPDEWMSVENYEKGAHASARLLEELAR